MTKSPGQNKSPLPLARSGQPTRRIAETVSVEHHKIPARTPANPPSLAGQDRPRSNSGAPSVVPLDTTTDIRSLAAPGRPALEEQQPEQRSIVERDPNYQTIFLPSGHLFYPFKNLAIRCLRASEKAKLHSSAQNNSLRLTVEAIGACLGDGVSAFDLTPGDFYFLMYWLRLNSMLKTPMVVRASCSDEKHNQAVFVGTEVEEDGKLVRKFKDERTLDLEITVQKTTLKTNYLELKDLDLSRWPALSGLDLGVETMRDLVDAAEAWGPDTPNLDELEYLAGYAVFLKRESVDEPLTRRLDIVRGLGLDAIEEFDDYIKTVTQYGVEESATITCPECRASNRVLIPFDARTFL